MKVEDVAKAIAGAFVEHGKKVNTWITHLEGRLADVEKSIGELPKPKDGAPGEPGKSVTIEEVTPVLKDIVASLNLKSGEDGKSVCADDLLPALRAMVKAHVEALPAAAPGQPGKDADPVDYDAIHKAIVAAVKEAVDGLTLPKPRDGEDGKDALALEILPEIDETKAYPRGTYANHRGGLWRSYERTSGKKGWEVLVNGVHEVTEEFDGERTLIRKTHLTNGQVIETVMTMPTILDKGVYRNENSYSKFDAVTLGGSLFIAQKDGPEGAPGSSPDWRLAVKRGRDASTPVKLGGK